MHCAAPGGGGSGMCCAAFGCHDADIIVFHGNSTTTATRTAPRSPTSQDRCSDALHGRTAGHAALRRASQHGPAVAKGG